MTQEFEVPKEQSDVEKAKCTLSDNELSTKCHEWIDKLCKSGAHAWCLRVPVDFNNDPDVLFTELLDRFMRNPKPVECVMSAEELGDIDALAEKDVAETMKIYEGRPNHKAMVRTWLAGYKQCLEDRGSNAIAVEDVRKLYDGTIQNVGTSVKRADMPTFDQWLADYKLKNKQHH